MLSRIPVAVRILAVAVLGAMWLALAVATSQLGGVALAATVSHTPKVTFRTAAVNPVAAKHTVVTQFSLVPDSGYVGNPWAYDTYTDTMTVKRAWAAPVADCGGGGKRCYLYTWSMEVSGHSQTISGAQSPNATTVLDVPEYAAMNGIAFGHYYSSYKRYYTQYVPSADNLNGDLALQGYVFSSAWVAQGSPGAHMANVSSSDTDTFDVGYTVTKGADSQCPEYAGTWTDATAVPQATSGNILAPDAADCAAQS
jgi:hypothetical protein